MRIAVWHNMPSGGGKRALHDQVAGLLARGHHVESWCPPTAEQTFLPLSALCREHVTPMRAPPDRARTPMNRLFWAQRRIADQLGALEDHCRAVAQEIAAGGFDVLFAHPCRTFRATPIARFVKLPSVLYLHEPYRALYEAQPHSRWAALPRPDGSGLAPSRIRAVLRDHAATQAARLQVREEIANAAAFGRILVNSLYSRESVLRAYGLESRVCRLGIDLVRFRPTGEPRERFLLGLGGLDPNKGPDRAVRAVGAIPAAERPPLVWAGNFADAEYAETIRRLARELGVEFELRVGASDAELVSMLSRARAFLYTSRLEPLGLAPLEANACGTPVVAIAEGGVRETMVHGVGALLAPDEDPNALAALLVRLVRDPALADDMGRRARSHVEAEWTLERGTAELERHLGEAAGRAPPASA